MASGAYRCKCVKLSQREWQLVLSPSEPAHAYTIIFLKWPSSCDDWERCSHILLIEYADQERNRTVSSWHGSKLWYVAARCKGSPSDLDIHQLLAESRRSLCAIKPIIFEWKRIRRNNWFLAGRCRMKLCRPFFVIDDLVYVLKASIAV